MKDPSLVLVLVGPHVMSVGPHVVLIQHFFFFFFKEQSDDKVGLIAQDVVIPTEKPHSVVYMYHP